MASGSISLFHWSPFFSHLTIQLLMTSWRVQENILHALNFARFDKLQISASRWVMQDSLPFSQPNESKDDRFIWLRERHTEVKMLDPWF